MRGSKKENVKTVIFRKRKGNGYIQIERSQERANEDMEALQKDGWFPVIEKPDIQEKEEPATTDLD